MEKMTEIIKIENVNDIDPLLTLKISKQELKALSGNLENVYLINMNRRPYMTNITKRGKSGSTVYLRIPKELRKNLDNKARIIRTEFKDKIFFGVEVKKNNKGD
ncbi:hypothetical protein JXB41_03360 [Candidatus Woesearchaeota archaeon]|nr:hypothetical protein [Candidatus Woesearchaeota archaeon]